MSRALEGRSVGELVSDVAEFGRRNPAAFLGGAALAGFAVARLATASAPQDRDQGAGTQFAGGTSGSRSPTERPSHSGAKPEAATHGESTRPFGQGGRE